MTLQLLASRLLLSITLIATLAVSGCSVERTESQSSSAAATINVDGSSTVLPVSMAVAEEFEGEHPNVKVKVERSGTGAGFDKFARKESDISNASRRIKSSEAEACQQNGVAYTEIMIGTDGLTVVVNPANDWCSALTIEQLAKLWEKDSTVTQWSDLDPSWPAEKIQLFGADSKSGTYDYFKEETVGKDRPMRTDYQPNSDDSVLVEGVAGDKFALGFFGFAYYIENQSKLKAVAIAPKGKDASAAVAPAVATIEDGSYTPLSRPLFIYVNNAALERQEVQEFAESHITDAGQKLVVLKGYIQLNAEQLAASRATFAKAIGK